MADAGDRMFCHSCGGVWLKDAANGLNCPHCQSDFTEIIEIPPDTEEPSPRPSSDSATHHGDAPPVNPWADHNPWANEAGQDNQFPWRPGYAHRTYRSPDGRWTFTTTATSLGGRDFSPGQAPNQQRQTPIDPLMPVLRSLDTIFQGLAASYRQEQDRDRAQNRNQNRSQSQSQDRDRGGIGPETETGTDAHRPREASPEFTPRLFPRDADGPQPMAPPLGTLGDILELFRADFGGNTTGGVRVMTGPNPLAILSTLLNVDRQGDAVFSQEELDRVISQLVDQNINRTGAPPAPESAIQSLPKKKVDVEMLGSEGKAECSICMESVEVGTEVTVLPCKHWFHYSCIEAWLIQHNTCPHCRRGIDSSNQTEGTSGNPVVIGDSPESSSPQRRRSSVQQQQQQQQQRQQQQQQQPQPTPQEHSGQSTTWFEQQSWNNPQTQAHPSETAEQGQQQSSHSDGGGGGLAGWLRNHFGGG